MDICEVVLNTASSVVVVVVYRRRTRSQFISISFDGGGSGHGCFLMIRPMMTTASSVSAVSVFAVFAAASDFDCFVYSTD